MLDKETEERIRRHSEEVKAFTLDAQEGLCSKESIIIKIDDFNKRIKSIDSVTEELQKAVEEMNGSSHCENNKVYKKLVDKYGGIEDLLRDIDTLSAYKTQILNCCDTLEQLAQGKKNFDKNICFSNIRELLKQNADVKIGQIEKEAGIRLGYMSRLQKPDNTAEPSMEFIVTAAKLLKVSLDTLVNVNLAGLTPHEQYLVKFFDKLKTDTIADKLDWKIEVPFMLNNLDMDDDGYVLHPLFSYQKYNAENDLTGETRLVSRIVFNSKSFGYDTCINDNCFNLYLNRGITFYLMNVAKCDWDGKPLATSAIEAWINVPKSPCNVLLTSRDNTPLAEELVKLYETIKGQMEHPRLSKDALAAIDSFMRDEQEKGPYNSSSDSNFPF